MTTSMVKQQRVIGSKDENLRKGFGKRLTGNQLVERCRKYRSTGDDGYPNMYRAILRRGRICAGGSSGHPCNAPDAMTP